MLKRRYLFFLVLLLVTGGLVAYRIVQNRRADKRETPRGPGGPVQVSAVVVKPRTFVDSLSVKGSIEANEQVQIRSQVPGMVTAIYFREGMTVRKGQALLQIDPSELNAQLQDARTQEELAAENAERARLLLEKEAISREEYETAVATRKSLQAQTQISRARLARTTIAAPFSGTIGLRNISAGTYLTPETVVANLINTNPVKVTFSVSEQYANLVKRNVRLSFTVAGSDRIYTAKVYAVEPGLDVNTRTLQLRALADNTDGTLRPGSFANVRLPLREIKNAILIPSEAVVPVQNGKKAFVGRNGKAQEVMIETTTRTEREVLVTSGLQAGDTVLTSGILTLKNGTPIKVSGNQLVLQ